MSEDFTLHFELPAHTVITSTDPIELERAFAREQIQTLLEFVTLYQDGQPMRPDSFTIVNAPGVIHALSRK